MGKTKTILLKRPTDKNTVVPSTTTLQYGEPLFDAKNNQLYVGNVDGVAISTLTPIGTSTTKTTFGDNDYVTKEYVSNNTSKLPSIPTSVTDEQIVGRIGGVNNYQYWDAADGCYKFDVANDIYNISKMSSGDMSEPFNDLQISIPDKWYAFYAEYYESCAPGTYIYEIKFTPDRHICFRASMNGTYDKTAFRRFFGAISISYNVNPILALSTENNNAAWKTVTSLFESSGINKITLNNTLNGRNITICTEYGIPPYVELTDPDGGDGNTSIRTRITATGIQVFENAVEIRNKTWKDIVPQ